MDNEKLIKKIKVSASSEYEIIIENGILKNENTGEMILSVLNIREQDKVNIKAVIITDDIVDELYSKDVIEIFQRTGIEIYKFVIKNGEQSKNITEFNNILEFLAENHFSRSDFIVALGGGVVGDLAGFVASSFLRGIRFIQIPTTFLACIDSSVGGKTAINLANGKNLVGAFYQPKLVICDLDTLFTLSDEIFSDGISEAIKYGMISDKKLFDCLLNKNIKENLEYIVCRCIKIKSDIVSKDEFDNSLRQLLNFGHTIGHAIEKVSGFKTTHGHAISIGMSIITGFAYKSNFCNKECYDFLIKALKKNDLPIMCGFSARELAESALSDKKISNGLINLILPREIGCCSLSEREGKLENLEKIIQLGLL